MCSWRQHHTNFSRNNKTAEKNKEFLHKEISFIMTIVAITEKHIFTIVFEFYIQALSKYLSIFYIIQKSPQENLFWIFKIFCETFCNIKKLRNDSIVWLRLCYRQVPVSKCVRSGQHKYEGFNTQRLHFFLATGIFSNKSSLPSSFTTTEKNKAGKKLYLNHLLDGNSLLRINSIIFL